jgi:hypothetical protein
VLKAYQLPTESELEDLPDTDDESDRGLDSDDDLRDTEDEEEIDMDTTAG